MGESVPIVKLSAQQANAQQTTAQKIAAAVKRACLAELQALKPGNVSIHSSMNRGDAGAALSITDFERSADVMAEPITQPGYSVGARILAAVSATRASVNTNTNLGIVLLLAPLLSALERVGANAQVQDWRRALAQVLAELSIADAIQTFAAIRLAQPGGLGQVAQEDVARAPNVTLREAMALAVERDAIAAQYLNDFELVFEQGVPACRAARGQGWSASWATTVCFLKLLSVQPDTLLARKFGHPVALAASRRAASFFSRISSFSCEATPQVQQLWAELLAWDRELKQAGQNPGTTADLVVACLFVLEIMPELRM